MKTIIAAAAATLLLAFTAHAGELGAVPPAGGQAGQSCAAAAHGFERTAYRPGEVTRCGHFLATGNVLQIRRLART